MLYTEIYNWVRIKNAITTDSVKISYYSGNSDVGFFTDKEEPFNIDNIWRFIPNNTSSSYRDSNGRTGSKLINGKDIKELILL